MHHLLNRASHSILVLHSRANQTWHEAVIDQKLIKKKKKNKQIFHSFQTTPLTMPGRCRHSSQSTTPWGHSFSCMKQTQKQNKSIGTFRNLPRCTIFVPERIVNSRRWTCFVWRVACMMGCSAPSVRDFIPPDTVCWRGPGSPNGWSNFKPG